MFFFFCGRVQCGGDHCVYVLLFTWAENCRGKLPIFFFLNCRMNRNVLQTHLLNFCLQRVKAAHLLHYSTLEFLQIPWTKTVPNPSSVQESFNICGCEGEPAFSRLLSTWTRMTEVSALRHMRPSQREGSWGAERLCQNHPRHNAARMTVAPKRKRRGKESKVGQVQVRETTSAWRQISVLFFFF